MKRVGHIYASEVKNNSGDFLIGDATKVRFKEILNEDNFEFINLNCRNFNLFNNVSHINNNFDYLIVGAGGLILPDSSSNLNSGWQWNITLENLQKISIPIYVISIGYNLFYNQTIDMPYRNNNLKEPKLNKIFTDHITCLIKKSKYFSMRHKNDINCLCDVIGESYRDLIKFEFCPTIAYTKSKNIITSDNKNIAFEIKDDRLWRRVYNIGEIKFYSELSKTIKTLIDSGFNVSFMSHDGSNKFYKFLIRNNVKIPYIDNSIGNETAIYNNYRNIKVLIATAGHSQMIGSAINGLSVISLVTHPKLRNFCDDTNNLDYVDPNIDFNFSLKLIDLINKKIN